DCEICLGTEIVAGELICKSCGARFGIYRGVPCLLIG
ncbi:MAG: Trm112 family protein, partial [Thermoproteota archaeon]